MSVYIASHNLVRFIRKVRTTSLLALTLLTGQSPAAPEGPRAPVSSDISLTQAQKSFETTPYQLKSAVDRDVCGSREVLSHYYVWAPSPDVIGGPDAVRSLLDRLQEALVVNNELYVESTDSDPNERHVARCRVRNIRGLAGPPRDCTTVAIFTQKTTWIRSTVDSQFGVCFHSATFRPSGSIQIDFEVKTNLALASIASSIADVLRDRFRLEVEQEVRPTQDGVLDYALLRSTSGLRDSTILTAGWREAVDFDVGVYKVERGLQIRGSAHALVSRQASGRLTNYSGLDDSQRTAYASALDAGIADGIAKACKTFRRLDAKRVDCD